MPEDSSDSWPYRIGWLENARLWMITDIAASRGRKLTDLVEDGIAGGVDVVVVRLKDIDRETFIKEATAIGDVCRSSQIPWVLSHNVELIDSLMPDGVHLGKADPPVNEARLRLRDDIAIGYSAHSLDEISFNAGLGADYCWYSPIFPTEKGGVVLDGLGAQAVTSALVTAVALGRKDVPFPVIMLGGINLENIGELVKRGVRRVAAIGALIGAPSVREAARAMKNALSADESFDLKE